MGSFNVSPNVDMGEYLRQKKLRESLMGGDPNQQISQAPQQASQAQIPPRPHPMQDQFQQMLQQAPKEENYQPSTRQKVGGVLAGIGAGIQQGSMAGIKAHQAITDKPLNDAKSTYQDKLKLAQGAYELENSNSEFDRKQQEGMAHMDEYRQLANLHAVQADRAANTPIPYQPTTQDEAIKFEQSKLKPPAPWIDKRISTDQNEKINVMQKENGSTYNVPYGKPKPVVDKIAEYKQMQNFSHQLRTNEIMLREKMINERVKNVDKEVSIRNQGDAEKLALKHLYETHPEYRDFINTDTWVMKPGTPKKEQPWYQGGDEPFKGWEGDNAKKYKKMQKLHSDAVKELTHTKKWSFAANNDDSDYEITQDK